MSNWQYKRISRFWHRVDVTEAGGRRLTFFDYSRVAVFDKAGLTPPRTRALNFRLQAGDERAARLYAV